MKLLDIVMVIVSIVSLVGSFVAMYVLALIGEALGALATVDTASLGITGVESVVKTFQFFLLVGWIWVLVVFFTSIYAIYVGIKRIRGK